jgi:hypothetical protein
VLGLDVAGHEVHVLPPHEVRAHKGELGKSRAKEGARDVCAGHDVQVVRVLQKRA